jgi:hypothetical protein
VPKFDAEIREVGIVHALPQPFNLDFPKLAEVFKIRVEFGKLKMHGKVLDS